MTISDKLKKMEDKEYGDFIASLAPTVDRGRFIGVRVPELRKLEREIERLPECEEFLKELPHYYYDENLLHSVILSRMKPYDRCLEQVEAFLPFIDNWAACDTLRPKVFEKNKKELLVHIKEWIESGHTYTCRFAIDMLMTYYLDEDFDPKYLKWVAAVKSEEYYVNMMIAWYFATALAKQWDEAVSFIQDKKLGDWVHNKTIQKARESNRITLKQKEYLKSLKV